MLALNCHTFQTTICVESVARSPRNKLFGCCLKSYHILVSATRNLHPPRTSLKACTTQIQRGGSNKGSLRLPSGGLSQNCQRAWIFQTARNLRDQIQSSVQSSIRFILVHSIATEHLRSVSLLKYKSKFHSLCRRWMDRKQTKMLKDCGSGKPLALHLDTKHLQWPLLFS